MKLRQTLVKPVSGYWDGGIKQVFDWAIDGEPKQDGKGLFVRISSWEANYWFCVAVGKTVKRTLANAKLHLRAITKTTCTFEYID